jgi:magnesium transporter
VVVDTVSKGKASIQMRLWRNGAFETDDFPLDRISDYLAHEGCLVWVDFCDPSSEDLNKIADELSLSPLAVEDALARAERAKATRYATHTFITVYTTCPPEEKGGEDQRLEASRISAFVLKRGIITVRKSDRFDMSAVVQRWEDNADLLKFGVGALVHGLLDVVVDGHFDAVQVLDDRIEGLENGLFDDNAQSKDLQLRTYRIRQDLVELRRVVLPMREVVNAVLRHRKDIEAASELDGWFDDLYDHVLRASEWTESLRDMVTTIFETNLSLQDARLNVVMKKLTAWAAIIAVPTAVTGYFGQNIPYPGFGRHWGFVLSCSVIVGIAGSLYLAFKKKRWL